MDYPPIPLGPDAAPPAREFVAHRARRRGLAGLVGGGALLLASLAALRAGERLPWVALGLLALLILAGAVMAFRPPRLLFRDGIVTFTAPAPLRTPADNVAGLLSDGYTLYVWFRDLGRVEPAQLRTAMAGRHAQGLADFQCQGFTLAQVDGMRRALGLAAPGPDEPAGRIEGFYRDLEARTPTAVLAPALVAANVAVFLLMTASGVSPASPDPNSLIAWGANFGPLTVGGGEWWRLLTCTFLHIGLFHLLCNMWALADVGPLVERLFGRAGFLVVYFAAGLLGSAAGLFWHPASVSAGASGAIFGLFGGLAGYFLRRRRDIPPEIFRHFRSSGLLFLGANLFLGWAVPGIGVAAHAGGLVTGLVLGLVLSGPPTAGRQGWALRTALAAGLAAVALGLAVVGLGHRPVPPPADSLEQAEKEFTKVQQRALARYNEAVGQLNQRRLAPPEFADALEREVLPPWREAAGRLQSLPEPADPAGRQDLADLREYARLRQEGWELEVRSIRENRPELGEQAKARQAAADRLARRLSHE